MTDFVTFARAHGVTIKDSSPSQRIRRCPTENNPRAKNGAYFWDGERGFVWAWDGDHIAHWYNDPNAREWTEAEKQAWKRKRMAADEDVKARRQKAAMRAQELMRKAVPGNHNYLHMKGFPDEQGLILEDGALLIPMRSLTGEILGAQLIRWIEDERCYEKKMLPGMKAGGAVFRMGDRNSNETCLVEGYATGLSVMAAMRSVGIRASVLVCFSAGNLESVAHQIKGRKYAFADNDKSGAGERSAKAAGIPYCMADEIGMDANDLHQKRGIMAVAQKIVAVRRTA